MRRRRRVEIPFFRENFAPLHLFLAGMFLIPAFLFQSSLAVKVVQAVLFAVLATLAGKRIKLGYFGFLMLSITFFNLLSPWGKVLFTVGPFRVTEGALEAGFLKSFTIIGLVFISLFTIRPELRIPGRLGGIIAKVFLYFERILEGKRRVEPKRFIASIDDILLGLYRPGMRAELPPQSAVKTTSSGYIVIFLLLALNYGVLFLHVPV